MGILTQIIWKKKPISRNFRFCCIYEYFVQQFREFYDCDSTVRAVDLTFNLSMFRERFKLGVGVIVQENRIEIELSTRTAAAQKQFGFEKA